MQWYEDEVRDLEARLSRTKFACPTVFYGSSSIRMWDTLSRDLDLPQALNAGFGGSTLEACALYFDRLIPPLRPAAMVLYAGDNDLGDGHSPDQVLAAFRMIAAKLERNFAKMPFGFMSIKPSVARFGIVDTIRKTNALIRQEIALHPFFYYIDIFDAMLSAAGQPRRELFLEDGLHLSREGYALWARVLKPYRNRMFIEDCRGIDTASVSFGQDESGVPQVVQSALTP